MALRSHRRWVASHRWRYYSEAGNLKFFVYLFFFLILQVFLLVKILLIVLMITSNTAGCTFFVKSLQGVGSSLPATIASAATNYFCSVRSSHVDRISCTIAFSNWSMCLQIERLRTRISISKYYHILSLIRIVDWIILFNQRPNQAPENFFFVRLMICNHATMPVVRYAKLQNNQAARKNCNYR